MSRRRPPRQSEETRREIAVSISEDLRSLVLILTRLFEADSEAGEALAHILNAKFAAERGLILSERLAAIADSANEPVSTH
ncbi:MAG: hypothetical protein ACJ8EL_11205 [Rhizomicrobium sp.]